MYWLLWYTSFANNTSFLIPHNISKIIILTLLALFNRTIFIKPPKECNTDKLWQLSKCVYGLADAPRSFYLHLKESMYNLSVSCHPLDAGLFFQLDASGQLMGIIACHVDDLLHGGGELFARSVIGSVRQQLELASEHFQAFEYIGMSVNQRDDSSIVLDQFSFADTLTPIDISKDRLKNKHSPLNEEELSDFRSLIGKLNWLYCIVLYCIV